jgi:hypothetical protein
MSTGHQAFSGNTSGVIMDSILHRQPAAARAYNPEVPAKLEEVIDKALEKDRKLRYQTASDIKADLQRVKRDSESARTATMMVPAAARRRRPWLFAAAAVLALLATAAVLWLYRPGGPSPAPTVEIVRRQVTANPEDDPILGAALSKDGQFLAYADLTGVHLKLIATGETRSLSLPPGFCFR